MTATETIPDVLADMGLIIEQEHGSEFGARSLKEHLISFRDRIESALASAEPLATVVESLADGHALEFHAGYSETLDALPIGTKLYAHTQPAAKVEAPGFCWDTVSRVVDALTRLGVATPESPSEQAAHVESMVLTLCHEAKNRPFLPTPASVPDGWLPIESAPKSIVDGQRVGGIYLLGYVPDADVADPAACIDIIWWEPLLPNNRGSRGKWCASKFGDDCEVVPSHWQPLPTPPTNPSELAP